MPVLLWCLVGYALTARFALGLMSDTLQVVSAPRFLNNVVSLADERRRRRAA